MIKQLLHKSFASILAVLVIFSTLSFSVEKHFCGTTLIDISVFTPAEKCGSKLETSSEKTEVSKKSCCKDVIEVFEGQDNVDVKSPEKLSKFQNHFLAVLVRSYHDLFIEVSAKSRPHYNYNSPILTKDFQVLDQVFLI